MSSLQFIHIECKLNPNFIKYEQGEAEALFPNFKMSLLIILPGNNSITFLQPNILSHFVLPFSTHRWNVLRAWQPLPFLQRWQPPWLHFAIHRNIYASFYSEVSLSLSGLWITCLCSVSCHNVCSSPVGHFH